MFGNAAGKPVQPLTSRIEAQNRIKRAFRIYCFQHGLAPRGRLGDTKGALKLKFKWEAPQNHACFKGASCVM